MLAILTPSESQSQDKHLIKTVGIPPAVLMENAARGALVAIQEWIEPGKSVIIFCGKGNNGGDGLALARLLAEQEIEVDIVLLSRKLSTDAAAQFEIIKKIIDRHRIHIFPFRNEHFISHLNIGIIVDALLGSGAKGQLKKQYAEAVLAINGLAKYAEAKILSLDIPTGLNGATGEIETLVDGRPIAVFAAKTVAMGQLKTGFFQGFAPEVTGEISIAALGAPYTGDPKVNFIEKKDIVFLDSPRPLTTSKFDQGFVLSVSGSRGMTGAAILSAMAALKSGCGLVTIATSKTERHIVAEAIPEIMTIGLNDDSTGVPISESYNELSEYLPKTDVLLLGNGIRVTEESKLLLRRLFTEVDIPIVADAAALDAIHDDLSLLKKRKAATILTPHLGEMARLLDSTAAEIEHHRIDIAAEFALKYKVILILKGAPTIIATPSGRVYINSTGNPGMATAGTGDVLAGLVAGLLAQEPSEAVQAAIKGAFLHGLAGDKAAEELTMNALTATDIISFLPSAFKELNGQ